MISGHVPRISQMFQAQERHLVAAIQFTEEQEDEVEAATAGFETFKASERQTSAGPSRNFLPAIQT